MQKHTSAFISLRKANTLKNGEVWDVFVSFFCLTVSLIFLFVTIISCQLLSFAPIKCFVLVLFLTLFLGLKSQDDHSLLRYPRSPSLQPSRDARQHQHVCFKGTRVMGVEGWGGAQQSWSGSSSYSQTRFTIWKRHRSWRVKGSWAVDLRGGRQGGNSGKVDLLQRVCWTIQRSMWTWWATTAADCNWSLLSSSSVTVYLSYDSHESLALE